MERAFALIRDASRKPIEWEVAQFIRDQYVSESLTVPDGPIVAINEHASDPHFEPAKGTGRAIKQGDWVLLDIWARGLGADDIYADITWVGYVGSRVPAVHQKIFSTVISARDAAVMFIADAYRKGQTVRGRQVDQVARQYITRAGYGAFFTHRLGHSIGTEVHGDAVNMDSFETNDTRTLVPGIGFSIEPGIYLPELGMRSEIDVYLSEQGPVVTTPQQREVVLLG